MMKETKKTIKKSMDLLVQYFGDDWFKILAWLHSKSEMFGGTAPITLMLNGREDAVLRFIENAKDENGWDQGFTHPEKCKRPNCKKPQKIRGLCSGCYTYMQKMVKDKVVTWESLVALGAIEPSTKSGPKKKDQINDWIYSLTENQTAPENPAENSH